MRVNVGINVCTPIQDIEIFKGLMKRCKYEDFSFFNDDMALINKMQVMNLVAKINTVRKGLSPRSSYNGFESATEVIDFDDSTHKLLPSDYRNSFEENEVSITDMSSTEDKETNFTDQERTQNLLSHPSFQDRPEDNAAASPVDQNLANCLNTEHSTLSFEQTSASVEAFTSHGCNVENLFSIVLGLQSEIRNLKERAAKTPVTPEPKTGTSYLATPSETPCNAHKHVQPVQESSPVASSSQKVSDIFKSFKFSPSPRKDQGPKKKKSIRDKTFAISSSQGIACLKAERDEKKRLEEEKIKKRESQIKRKQTVRQEKEPNIKKKTARKSLKRSFSNTLLGDDEESNTDEPQSLASDGEDALILLKELYENEVTNTFDMKEGQFVMVKILSESATSKGRKHHSFMTFLGKVSYTYKG